MASSRVPFVGNFNFLVEIDRVETDASIVVGGFSEVSGVGSETEVIDVFVGSSPEVLRIPGKTRFLNVTLRKGVTNSNELYLWRRAIERGETDRRSGAIILLDHDMTEKTRWNFYDAWPCRYEAPELDSSGNAVSVETLELCVGRLERAVPSGEEVEAS